MNYLYEKVNKYTFIIGVKTIETISYINNGLMYVYDNNIIAKQMTDITYYYINMMWCDYYNVICNMPTNVNWYGTSCLIKNKIDGSVNSVIRKIPIQQSYYNNLFKQLLFMQDGSSLLRDDKYTIDNVHNNNDIDKCVSNIGDILDKQLSIAGDIEDCIFILEYFNMFIVRYAMYIDMDSPDFAELIQSNVSFLSIEYTHPNMESSVFFELGQQFSIIGNELFSPSFVKYLLEHQFNEYIFDKDYVLNIMDGNMDIQQLTSNQYIRLLENRYHILTTDSE